MKRLVLYALISIGIILSLVSINMHKKDSLQMMVMDKNYNVYCVDFMRGEVKPFEKSIQDYCKERQKTLILSEQYSNKSIVKILSGEGIKTVFETDMIISNNPVTLNNDIYFIAKTGIYDKYQLYKYSNKRIEKVYKNELDGGSPLLKHHNKLIFVEKVHEKEFNDKKYSLMLLDANSGNIKRICDGRFPCWKEEGETLLCEVYGNHINKQNEREYTSFGHGVININTSEVFLLKKNIVCLPPYTTMGNVIFHWGFDDTPWGYEKGEAKILYIDSMEQIPVKKYQSVINGLVSKFDFETIFKDGIYCDWW